MGPLIIRNDMDTTKQVTLHGTLPRGWSQKPVFSRFAVQPHDAYPIQLTLTPPVLPKGTWQTLVWSAESDGRAIGTVTLRVDLESNGLPQ